MTPQIILYALERAGHVIYVGQTKFPIRRFKKHRRSLGSDITMAVLDVLTDQPTANLGERAWILYYAQRGRLLNIKDNPYYSIPAAP